ncbi:MAG TPA: type II 3-dehydroquinate dehydratase [Gammaproteobacteria bacterium]|nr:type II 3-dehydroquinate dehydratase [Gammaproteobacteria bacterium]
MSTVLVLHGPNLNLLGSREPDIYGTETLSSITKKLRDRASETGIRLQSFQSNAEHELIERVHNAPEDQVDFIILNPAALTHTSIALRDALIAVQIPFIELHLSNIYRREEFRHLSYFSDIAEGVISGLGSVAYLLALEGVIQRLNNE